MAFPGVCDVFSGLVYPHDVRLPVTLLDLSAKDPVPETDVEEASARQRREVCQFRRNQAAPAAHKPLVCFGIHEHPWRSILALRGGLDAAQDTAPPQQRSPISTPRGYRTLKNKWVFEDFPNFELAEA